MHVCDVLYVHAYLQFQAALRTLHWKGMMMSDAQGLRSYALPPRYTRSLRF